MSKLKWKDNGAFIEGHPAASMIGGCMSKGTYFEETGLIGEYGEIWEHSPGNFRAVYRSGIAASTMGVKGHQAESLGSFGKGLLEQALKAIGYSPERKRQALWANRF